MCTARVAGGTHLGFKKQNKASSKGWLYFEQFSFLKSDLMKVRRWRTFIKSDFGFFSAVGAEKSKIGFKMIVFVKLPQVRR
jgi:hypothetical protein